MDRPGEIPSPLVQSAHEKETSPAGSYADQGRDGYAASQPRHFASGHLRCKFVPRLRRRGTERKNGRTRGVKSSGLHRLRQFGIVLALLATASTWFYVDYILRAHQIADAAVHNIPRGNLSDLYPRWLGALELLLHHRNPYSPEITREIQQGYYGRPLDSSRQEDPKDQQGFAYPVYVVFLLAPTVSLPFDEVIIGFRWFLIAIAAVSVLLWLRVLRWKPAWNQTLIFLILAPGWWPMVQGIKLQQLSLLVAGLLAACGASLAAGWLLVGGVLLSLATIKPQLTWPLVLWLLLWAASEWRRRWRLIFGFALGMTLLLVGAQLLLPGWLGMFIDAIRQYHQYTQNQSLLVFLFGSILGRTLEALCLLGCTLCVWRMRNQPASSAAFGRALAVVLALTVVIVPMFAPYNQVLLIPAILALVNRFTSPEPILPAFRLAGFVGGLLLFWPWIASLLLSAAYVFLTPQLRDKSWSLPFYSNFLLPLFVFGLALYDVWTSPSRGLPDGAAAE
jgi:hypothetical protein